MHPYFINPAIDALQNASGDERAALIQKIAACVGDEATLRAIIGIDPEEFKSFYPDMLPKEMSTNDTISSFISHFSSEKQANASEVEQIIAAPAIDYAAMLDDEPESDDANEETDATSDAISAFLKAVPAKTAKKSTKTQTPEQSTKPDSDNKISEHAVNHDDPALAEALFKLMVKNKNYSKALEIITDLSLNNPKKSIYFAYQMRFLKKLIKNQENNTNIS